ncbi:hypothetical protein BvCmsKSP012_01456 [Escherichia coli]|nr:hypothetical protein BvCmsKSP012_01456 [Escherichia coli]
MNDSYRQFENWWSKDKSQFTGDDELKEFAWVIWQASRSAIELDIDCPNRMTTFGKMVKKVLMRWVMRMGVTKR